MKEILISSREEGQKLMRYLGRYLPEAGSGFLHKMIRKKNITLNHKKTEAQAVLRAGDRIQIYFRDETLDKFRLGNHKEDRQDKPVKTRLRKEVIILKETEDILVFHKPAGMLTQKSTAKDDSLNDYLLDYCRGKGIFREEYAFRPSVANRLDRNTSGIVLCGTSVKGLQMLSQMLKDRSIKKYYLAIAAGKIREDARIDGFLVKNEKDNTVRILDKPKPGASRIETAYEVVCATDKATLLKVDLITGKTHQIRAHMASVGHPLLGDRKYARQTGGKNETAKAGRPMLHGYEVVIPAKEGPERITDPLPKDFQQLMEAYGLKADNLILA